MTEAAAPARRPRAFRAETAAHLASQAAKAVWWSAAAAAGRALVRPGEAAAFQPQSPPPPEGALRRAYLDAFAKDAADVAAGLYPVSEPPASPAALARRFADLIADAREVEARRRRDAEGARRGAVEARAEPEGEGRPAYYRQNFHFQSGGWFTAESAARYEAQVEGLFAGAAGPMRRRALSLLARAWRGRDHRGLTVVDVATGSGAFLRDLRAAFPRAAAFGLDLSHAYLREAGRRSGAPGVQAAAERLPFADASLDALTCIYLFHELPPRVRREVAAEFARVLKPGGVLAFADSLQRVDAPELGRPLETFPVHFHEPFYRSYQQEDLRALFGEARLELEAADTAFFTKALLLRRS